MKRIKYLLTCVILIGTVIIVFSFKPVTQFFTVMFWEEMFKIRQNTEYGAIGRDTVCVIGNGKFQIIKTSEKNLIMYSDDNTFTEVLLRKVSKHKIKHGFLYIISDDGYGIVDGNTNLCRLYITVPKDEFIQGYGSDSKGNIYTISALVKDKHVQYLDSLDDFSENEKNVFDKMR